MATGQEYVAALNESDRSARHAFQETVLKLAAPGSCLFDFGSGPGLDAKDYAARGFRVVAYDNDARMCQAFTAHCDAEIERGQVTLCQGPYQDFLARYAAAIGERYAIDLVTSNFAPLNLIEEPRELFSALHALTTARGKILASVLSPWFVGDMRYPWWWANRSRYQRDGRFCVAGASGGIFRRSRADFAAQAAPYFRLETVLRGRPQRPGTRLCSSGGAGLAMSRYMFLLFTKQ